MFPSIIFISQMGGFRKRLAKAKKKENTEIVTIKCLLSSVLRHGYHDMVVDFIEKRSIEATKMCHLGSLFFLNQVQSAFDRNHFDYFVNGNDETVNRCFRAVLKQNIKKPPMTQEFRRSVEQNGIVWPNNDYFGNATNDLIDTYITNVKNNLSMHSKKRLKSYLKLRAHIHNLNEHRLYSFNDEDVNNAVDYAIHQKDSIVVHTMEDVAKRDRRQYLLDMVRAISWFDIPNDDLHSFTKIHWFKSLQLWIAMQRAIDVENLRKQQDHVQNRKPSKPKRNEFKNLKVIPICNTQRTHFPMDTYTLYKMMCATGVIPIVDGRQISSNDVSITFLVYMKFLL